MRFVKSIARSDEPAGGKLNVYRLFLWGFPKEAPFGTRLCEVSCVMRSVSAAVKTPLPLGKAKDV